MTTTCIILCGGSNARWGGYRGVARKHLVELEGERLINRTLRLVARYAPGRTVVVLHPDDREAYAAQLPASVEFFEVPVAAAPELEAQKFLSSRALWNAAGRTIVLLGDVWFSEAALATIFVESPEEWTAFGRAGASRFTGCPWGELFAQRFTSSLEHGEQLERLDAKYRNRTCRRAAAGWAHYNLMIGRHPHAVGVGERYVEIDDFTEDFDHPGDYDAWVRGRAWHASGVPGVADSPLPRAA